jgi:dTDP-4-amino-4,6-dideoxygalactose transaminase
VLAGTDWILGKAVNQFEEEFAEYCEVKHGVGTDSGMSALELVLRVFGVEEGDEVITAANTFIATALAISNVGATPVLVDADPVTHNIDPDLVEAAITSRTKAIIPVHLYGHPADMDAVVAIAKKHGLKVIEDACQAHGGRYRGRRVGSLGDAAAFSFYPSKNLGAYGDGGIIVTDDDAAAEELRMLRNYGSRRKYEHVAKGFNRRLDTLQAAALQVKLEHLDEWNDARRAAASWYEEALANQGVDLPQTVGDVEHVWHLYVVRTRERDALRDSLEGGGVQTGIHYPIPIHLQAAYADLSAGRGDFPIAERDAEEVLSLPMHPQLDRLSVRRVASEISTFNMTRSVA